MSKPSLYHHSFESRFQGLEEILFSIRKTINGLYGGDVSEIRALSGYLRDLTCRVSQQDGVLWAVKKLISFDDVVDVPNVDNILKKIDLPDSAAVFWVAMDHGKWKLRGPELKKQSLREYFEKGEAIRFKSSDNAKWDIFSPCKVILAVANNIGVHNPAGVSENFAKLAMFHEGNVPVFVRFLDLYARLVVEVGERILKLAVSSGYIKTRKSIDLPESSLEYAKIEFPLKMPEASLDGINRIRLDLRLGTAKEALESYLPFTVKNVTIAHITVKTFVTSDVKIGVEVFGLSEKQKDFFFDYPKVIGASLNYLEVVWVEKTLQVSFNGQVKHLPL